MDTVAQAETSAIISACIDNLKLEQFAPSTLEKYAQNLRYSQKYPGGSPITEYSAFISFFMARYQRTGDCQNGDSHEKYQIRVQTFR